MLAMARLRWMARYGGGRVLSFEPQEKKLSCQKRNFRISVILIKTFTAHVEQDTFPT